MPSQPGERELVGLLEELAGDSAVAFPESARTTLLRYGELLLDWGRRINLTGAGTLHQLLSEHFPDAFALAARLQTRAPIPGGDAEAIADVGSGGGLPAIPLSILLPASQICMFEPTGKKVAFLRTAIRELDLGQRLRVSTQRVGRRTDGDLDLDGTFDVAISRATFPPPIWLDLAWRLVRPGGRVFALTTRGLEQWPPELELVHASPDRRRADRWLNELRRST